MTTSVLVVDDQPLFCSGIGLLLDAQSDLEFAGAAHTGEAALEQVRRSAPDVVLMDLRMPDGNGIAATRRIHHEHPAVQVLVLTTFRDRSVVQQARSAGAAGFITKDATPAELLGAIRDTAAGRPVAARVGSILLLPDPLAAVAPNPEAIAALTARELGAPRVHRGDGARAS